MIHLLLDSTLMYTYVHRPLLGEYRGKSCFESVLPTTLVASSLRERVGSHEVSILFNLC